MLGNWVISQIGNWAKSYYQNKFDLITQLPDRLITQKERP